MRRASDLMSSPGHGLISRTRSRPPSSRTRISRPMGRMSLAVGAARAVRTRSATTTAPRAAATGRLEIRGHLELVSGWWSPGGGGHPARGATRGDDALRTVDQRRAAGAWQRPGDLRIDRHRISRQGDRKEAEANRFQALVLSLAKAVLDGLADERVKIVRFQERDVLAIDALDRDREPD